MSTESTATRLRALLERLLQVPMPVRLRAWDGSTAGPADAPTLIIRHRRALRRIMWQPNELGFARAYISGEMDLEGDLYDALNRLAALVWRSPDIRDLPVRAIFRDFLKLGIIGTQPTAPPEEMRVAGARHSKRRDKQAVSQHYDVGNDFYRIVLGESMVYSCAYWTRDDAGYGLADAQRDKLDLICRKLALQPGMRLLDVGCGWGSLALHAAREYGVAVVGITLSAEQADYARKQIAEAGLTEPDRDPTPGLSRPRRRPVRRASPASAWPSTSGRLPTANTRPSCTASSSRAAGCSTTRSRGCTSPRRRPTNSARSSTPTSSRTANSCRWAHRHPAGGGGLRGTRRARAPRTLRPDPARLGHEPGIRLGERGTADQPWSRPRLATVHGGVGARLRAGTDRRQSDPWP